MPGTFNWLDVVIALLLALSLLQGIRAGLIRSVFSILGITVGLTAAIIYYVRVSEWLLSHVGMPQFMADAFGFFAIFALTATAVHLAGSFFAVITRIRLFRAMDKACGSAVGLLIGLAVVGVLLILLTAFPLFPGFQDHIEQSSLAPAIIETTHLLYSEVSAHLSLEIPRLAIHPEELAEHINDIDIYSDHSGVNYAGLNGAACFVCYEPVEFLGYLDNRLGSVSPKFVCTECERTSDGCQTYEGYHLMYEDCPVILGNRGYRFDCGIWTNYSYHRPLGPCAYCGAN